MNIIASFSKTTLSLLALSWAAVLALQSRPAPSAALGRAPAAQAEPYAALRRRMIERDLRGRGIKNARVLEAIEAVPRHLFVPEKIRHAAYEDRALPIGDGQTISQPYIVALMTELLDPQPAEKVLEIGTGSGYQTAVLAHLAQRVYSIEILPALGASARRLLDQRVRRRFRRDRDAASTQQRDAQDRTERPHHGILQEGSPREHASVVPP